MYFVYFAPNGQVSAPLNKHKKKKKEKRKTWKQNKAKTSCKKQA